MKERLPPLQGLYCFYKAAEMGSFKDAAHQLSVTSAAISQQIRQLEEWLGVQLFERQHRKVKLTQQGHILFRQTDIGFGALQDGVRQVNKDQNPDRLSISVLPSLAQHWLVPRIGEFSSKHPSLSLFLQPDNKLVDFKKESVDLCIRYGKGEYPDIESQWLMDDHLYPVCHPIYRERHQISSLHNLVNVNLIEDARPDMNWKYWLSLAGIESEGSTSSLQYEGSHFVLDGALAVQGVALMRHSLAWRYIEQGTLVKIGDIAVQPTFSYYLCAPAPYFKREKNRAFQQWIKQQMSDFWLSSQVKCPPSNRVIKATE